MFDFLQQHAKAFIIGGIIVLFGLFGVLLLLNKKTTPATNSNTNTPYIIDDNNKFLQNNNLSAQDKYIMLLGQSMTQDYGTQELEDTRPLQDLLNQSTSAFAQKIQSMIDGINKTKNVITVVDANTIKLLSSNDNAAQVTMNGVTTDQVANKKTNITSLISFVKQGDYWLVDNITFSNR